MKKKLIGLSILLLVLLLGLSSISYANSYRDFTEIEIKNVLYKAWINAGHSETDVINAISTHDNNGNITTVVNALNNTNNCIISFGTGTSGWNECYISCYNSLSNTHPYFYNGKISFKNSPSGTMYKILYNGSYSTASVYYYYESRTDYIYYGDTFYNSGSGTTVTHAANTYSPITFFDEWYYEDIPPFAFVTDPGLGTVTYDNYEYTLFNKSSSGDIFLGQLFIPNGIIVNYADVLNYYWYWNNWQVRTLTDNSIRTQLISNNDGNLVFNVYLKRNYIYINTYYQYIFTSTQTEPYQFVSGGCYVKDSHTVITNGVVDPYNTFSGDYKDEYNSIIDNQQDVDNIVAGTEPILDFLNNTDIPSGDEPTFSDLPSIEIDDDSEEFFTWLLSSFLSVLNNNSNSNLTIPLFNNNYTIPSNFFVLTIEPLRTFINLGWWFICGVPFLKFIRSSIEKLKGGNIPLADEKSDLLGHII